jgi:Arc/MetJ-type ribon-helix-helix transcriptional regulator
MRLRIYAAGEVDSVAKIMISLPDGFLRRVDRTAKAQGRSRSELIREALRGMLADQETVSDSWKDALAPLRELEEQWVGRWDSTDIIRYYRETRYGRQDRR